MYELFEKVLIQSGIPVPEREYKFHPSRKWRIDFAWPAVKLAVEIEGGAFSSGRHTRGAGFRRDIEKYNELALAGYTLFRFMPEQLMGCGIDTIVKFFKRKEE
jgi:very-short-patch-repair endonuclease